MSFEDFSIQVDIVLSSWKSEDKPTKTAMYNTSIQPSMPEIKKIHPTNAAARRQGGYQSGYQGGHQGSYQGGYQNNRQGHRHSGHQGGYKGHQSSYHGGQQGQQKSSRLPCFLCDGQHAPWVCSRYNTALAVRRRLEQIGRCRGCTMYNAIHGEGCVKKWTMQCKDHPSEPHFGWTCDGKEHPGWQGKADR